MSSDAGRARPGGRIACDILARGRVTVEGSSPRPRVLFRNGVYPLPGRRDANLTTVTVGPIVRPSEVGMAKTVPGFTADRSVRAGVAHRFSGRPATDAEAGEVTPQFWTGRHFACAALAIAILAGQEELIPVAARVCFSA